MDENIEKITKNVEPEKKPEREEPPIKPPERGRALRRCSSCGKEFKGESEVGIAYCPECVARPIRPNIPL